MADADSPPAGARKKKIIPAVVLLVVGMLIAVVLFNRLHTTDSSRAATTASATHATTATDLPSLIHDVRTVLAQKYPEQVIKDASDSSDAWSIAGIAPGYTFSTSADLGSYHVALKSADSTSGSAAQPVPVAALSDVMQTMRQKGGVEIPSPVPRTYPSKPHVSSYVIFKNAACYADRTDDQTAVSLDCAYTSDFAKVATVVKPFVNLYRQSVPKQQAGSSGKDYAVHLPFSDKSADGAYQFAAVPLNQTVAYYYRPIASHTWKFYTAAGTGLKCSALSGATKAAFATVCKV
jgi:hypothetical protein